MQNLNLQESNENDRETYYQDKIALEFLISKQQLRTMVNAASFVNDNYNMGSCLVCQKPLLSPKMCNGCGRLFCEECDGTAEFELRHVNCDSLKVIDPHQPLMDLLAQLKLKCTIGDCPGKDEELPYQIYLQEHQALHFSHATILCPLQCGSMITKSQADNHLLECPSEIYTCECSAHFLTCNRRAQNILHREGDENQRLANLQEAHKAELIAKEKEAEAEKAALQQQINELKNKIDDQEKKIQKLTDEATPGAIKPHHTTASCFSGIFGGSIQRELNKILASNPRAQFKTLNGRTMYLWENHKKLTFEEIKGKTNVAITLETPLGSIQDNTLFRIGQIMDGQLNGIGRRVCKDQVQEGQFENGVLNGYGHVHFQSGASYFGLFVNGKRKGLGKMIHRSKDVYEGHFEDDQKCGFGKYTWTDGSFYEGNWLNDKRAGRGKMTNSNGRYVEGKWGDDRYIGSP